MAKYIFVTGGVVSGLGKGLTAASLGRILKQRSTWGSICYCRWGRNRLRLRTL